MVKQIQIDNRERDLALDNRGAPVIRKRDSSAILEEVRRNPPHDAKAECPACYQQGVSAAVEKLDGAEDIELAVCEIREVPLVPNHLHVGASFQRGVSAVLTQFDGGDK